MDAFDRHKRCEACHYAPCICTVRVPHLSDTKSLRGAIEKGLASKDPLKALAIELEIIAYLKTVIPQKDVDLLAKILGYD